MSQLHSSLPATLEVLERLVAFDTTSHLSNLDCIAYIESYLKEYGISGTRLNNAEGNKASLFATLGKDISGGVVFSGHTDVVPVAGQNWNTQPFVLHREADRVVGRGTCDMKGFIACVMVMIPYFKTHAKKPVHFAFSYDEEVGCLAAPDIAEFLKQQSFKPSLVVVGEPTNMQVVDAHKATHAFKTIITGLEGHSSKPHQGVNAVMIAAELVHLLNQEAEAIKNTLSDLRFDPSYTSIHVGTLHGGTARNIIPNHCEFLWEIRALPKADIAPVIARFEATCKKLLNDMKQRFHGAEIRTIKIVQVPGLKPEPQHACNHHVMLAAGSNGTHCVSYATEAGVFQQAGFPTLICGPGDIEQAHKSNEFVTLQQLSECLTFLERLVSTLD